MLYEKTALDKVVTTGAASRRATAHRHLAETVGHRPKKSRRKGRAKYVRGAPNEILLEE